MECGAESTNYGYFASPEECAAVAFNDDCHWFMFSQDHPDWDCRCCTNHKPDGWSKDEDKNWNVYHVV